MFLFNPNLDHVHKSQHQLPLFLFFFWVCFKIFNNHLLVNGFSPFFSTDFSNTSIKISNFIIINFLITD
jgi:hypothetical protein